MRINRSTDGNGQALTGGRWLVVALLLAGGAPFTHAADGTWNVNADGNWITTNRWLGSTIPGSTSISNSTDTATFGFLLTAARTVTVDANRNIKSIIFNDVNAGTFGYMLSGGSLLLTGGGKIEASGASGAHTDTVASDMTIVGNGTNLTVANNSSMATRLLSMIGDISGQSTTGSTTTLILGGSNSGAINTLGGSLKNGVNGGNLGITKDDATTWVIGNGGSYSPFTGPITINGGTLRTVNVTATFQTFGAATAITLANSAGAVLDASPFSGRELVIGSLAGGGTAGGSVLLGSDFTTGANNLSTSFAGSISGSAGIFRKIGSGTQTLAGTNSNTGTTIITGGAIGLDFSAGITPVNILAAGTTLSLAGGGLQLTGNAGGVNSQSLINTTTLGAGANSVALSLNSATSLLLDLKAISRSAGATLDVTLPTGIQSTVNGVRTTTANLANSVLVSAAANGVAFASVGGTDWAGLSSSNLVAMTTYATGVGNYTPANNVDVANGDSVSGVTVNTLRFNGDNTLTLAGINTVNTGGILVTPGATTGATMTGDTIRSGGGKELVIINNGAQLTVDSVIANSTSGASALTLSGAGTTLLNGLNTYTGSTYLHNGTVKAGSAQALGVGSNVTIADNPNAILDLNGTALTIGALNGGGTQGKDLAYRTAGTTGGTIALGTGTLTLSGTAAGDFGGTITGLGGGVVKTGTGTQALRGRNTFTGGVIIKEGALMYAGVQGNTGAFGPGPVTLGDAAGGSANATLLLPDSFAYVITNPIILAPNATGILSITASGGASAGQQTFTGGVTGTNDLTVGRGLDTITLTGGAINNKGNVTYVGYTGSALAADIGSNVVHFILTGSAISSQRSRSFACNFFNSGTISNGITAIGTAGKPSISGQISANLAGGIVQNSVATLTLSGNNLFTAPVQILSGTLAANGAQSLGVASPVTLADDATALLSVGASQTIGALAGGGALGGNVSLGANRLTIGSANTDTTYAGVISGSGGITKVGAGTLILSGTNTCTGSSYVNAGSLLINGTLTGAGMFVNAGATLSGTGTVQTSVTVSNGATLSPGYPTGSLTVTNGAVTLTNGTLAVKLYSPFVYSSLVTAGTNLVLQGTNNTLDVALVDFYRWRVPTTFRVFSGSAVDTNSGSFGTLLWNGAALNGRYTVEYGADYIDILVRPGPATSIIIR